MASHQGQEGPSRYMKNMLTAGPSSIAGTSIQSYSTGRGNNLKCVTVMKYPDSSNKKVTWKCKVCEKELSSKRSYTEHMNIHNKTRPFRCDHCDYAAASQMTLHRHKLRNHTPRAEWGYKCPYCEEVYMEPAGYQQHVQNRHPGLSATYGCPFSYCKFLSKSQRHFREHIAKHEPSEKVEGGINPLSLNGNQLTRYMVNDECGYGSERKKKSILIRPLLHPITMAPKVYIPVSTSSNPPNSNKNGLKWHVEKIRAFPAAPNSNTQIIKPETKKEYTLQYYSNTERLVRQPIRIASQGKPQHGIVHQTPTIDENEDDGEDDDDDDGPPVLDRQQEDPLLTPDTDWIEAEIEVSSSAVPMFPNGFMEEELD